MWKKENIFFSAMRKKLSFRDGNIQKVRFEPHGALSRANIEAIR